MLSQFPTLKTRRLICPVCMLLDDGELMVHCEACKRWFHKTCVAEFDEAITGFVQIVNVRLTLSITVDID